MSVSSKDQAQQLGETLGQAVFHELQGTRSLDFTARTTSGTLYMQQRGFLRVYSRVEFEAHTYRPWFLKSGVARPGLSWDDINAWPEVEIPVVGECLLISCRDEWRISTPMVEVQA